ncbi:MAG: S-layer family protein [Cyanobacteria bacterium P01_B01_bin.77]
MSISRLSIPLITYMTTAAVNGCIVFGGSEVLGQITPDSSLPTPSTVLTQTEPNGSVQQQIEGGTTRGTNLFHSFSSFDIPSEHTARFGNELGIDNIFTRITGSNVSSINGSIQTQGTANLFLLNPHGIMFGPEARLELGGSFIASSAERILFSDGFQFDATAPGVEPLLTLSTPVGLGFGATPGVLASNANVTLDTSGAFPRAVISSQLAVPEEHTLGLLGGPLNLNGGQFLAPGGRIELASIAEPTIVGLQALDEGFRFKVDSIDRFSDIHLANLARVDVSGDRSGAVSVYGRNIILSEGAQINALTVSPLTGDDITIQATESLQVLGATTIPGLLEPFYAAQGLLVRLFSAISTDTIAGNAGNIDIITRRLTIRDGARITANADPNRLDDRLENGLDAVTGRGGNITVNASDSVEVIGFTGVRWAFPDIPIPQLIVEATGSSTLSTLVTRQAEQAGDLTIHTDNVIVRDSGLIATLTTGNGDGGDIKITARDSIVVEGIRTDGVLTSNINASAVGASAVVGVFPGALSLAGNGGTIMLTARELLLKDGGAVVNNTSTGGSGGNIAIDVSLLEISGESTNIQTSSGGSGSAGDIEISADILRVSNGGEISVAGGLPNPLVGGTGTGPAGRLSVGAETIVLDNGNLSGQTPSELGGGNLLLNANTILLRNDSLISTEATGTATGGNITINSVGGFLISPPSNNSDIIAIANEGRGGEIIVNVNQLFGFTVQDNPTNLRTNRTNDISASSAAGPQGIVNLAILNVDPSQGLVELPVAPIDTPPVGAVCSAAVQTGSAFILSGRGGLPPAPTEPLGTSSPWEDWYIAAPQTSRASLSSTLYSNHHRNIVASASPIVEAQGWVRADDGQVSLVTNLSTATPANDFPMANCRQLPISDTTSAR